MASHSGTGVSEKKLEELRRANEKRWDALKELHKQLLANSNENDGTVLPRADTSLQERLEVELELLNSVAKHEETTTFTNSDFPRELVESFDALQETSSVLEQRRQREERKLKELKALLARQIEVRESLKMLKKSSLLEESSKGSTNGDDTDNNEITENRWLRKELDYVSKQLQEKLIGNKKEKPDSKTSAGRKRSHASSMQQSEPPKGRWTLDRLVLELIKLRQSSSIDPYLCIDQLPIDAKHIALLTNISVIQVHPNNPSLVCLSDYGR